jgi:hypothetical protein
LGLTGSHLFIDRIPQGLKPASFAIPSGTAEAVPFPKPFYEDSLLFLGSQMAFLLVPVLLQFVTILSQ